MSASLRLVQEPDGAGRGPGPDLVAGWVQFMAAMGCAPATIGIRTRSGACLIEHAGVSDPLALTREHVIAWLARPIKPWSRLTYYSSIKGWSAWLRDFGGQPEADLLKGIPRPKTPDATPRPIDDAVIERLLAAPLSPRAHAYVRLALYQALRVHEIAKIRAEDFDFAAGWLTVTGKGSITRPIPVHTEIARMADTMPSTGYWFPSYADPSRPVNSTGVSQTIKNALAAAGSNATAHQLRDTAATRMQRTFKDIRVTQSLLRHRNIQSTMKYTAASNEDLQQALGGLDWVDAAQQPAEGEEPPMSPAEIRSLMAKLMKALEGVGE